VIETNLMFLQKRRAQVVAENAILRVDCERVDQAVRARTAPPALEYKAAAIAAIIRADGADPSLMKRSEPYIAALAIGAFARDLASIDKQIVAAEADERFQAVLAKSRADVAASDPMTQRLAGFEREADAKREMARRLNDPITEAGPNPHLLTTADIGSAASTWGGPSEAKARAKALVKMANESLKQPKGEK